MTEAVWVVLSILGVIQWAPQHQKAEFRVFQSAKEMAAVWTSDGGKSETLPAAFDEVGEIRVYAGTEARQMPKVDFAKHTVVALFAGEKSTGGYGIKAEKVLVTADKKKAVVLYSEKSPAPGGPVTMVMAYPSHVVVIEKFTGEIKFVSVDSEEGKKLVEVK